MNYRSAPLSIFLLPGWESQNNPSSLSSSLVDSRSLVNHKWLSAGKHVIHSYELSCVNTGKYQCLASNSSLFSTVNPQQKIYVSFLYFLSYWSVIVNLSCDIYDKKANLFQQIFLTRYTLVRVKILRFRLILNSFSTIFPIFISPPDKREKFARQKESARRLLDLDTHDCSKWYFTPFNRDSCANLFKDKGASNVFFCLEIRVSLERLRIHRMLVVPRVPTDLDNSMRDETSKIERLLVR